MVVVMELYDDYSSLGETLIMGSWMQVRNSPCSEMPGQRPDIFKAEKVATREGNRRGV